MVFDYTREYLQQAYSVLELGATAPDPVQTFVGLIRSGVSIPTTATLIDLIQNEVVPDNPINGYTRPVLGQLLTGADSVGDTITVAEHGRTGNQEVWLFGIPGSLPSPLVAKTPYYVQSPTTNTLKLAATSSGSAIDLTTSLSGTWYMKMGGAFNATNKRFESIYDECRFTATTNDIVYQGVFIASYADSLSSVQISGIDTTGDVITTAAVHGRSTGDRVLITGDSGSTQPGGTVAGTAYWVRVLNTTTFTLHTSAANASANTGRVDITTAGSGVLRIRNARGISVGYDYFASAVTIPAGRTQVLQIPAYFSNQRTDVGVP